MKRHGKGGNRNENRNHRTGQHGGCGNRRHAEKEIVTKEEITGSAATEQTVRRMAEKYGIKTTRDNRAVAGNAQVLILAVKPQFLETVIGEIRDDVREETLLVTVAAGKSIDWYEKSFGRPIRLVRCMPNTPTYGG